MDAMKVLRVSEKTHYRFSKFCRENDYTLTRKLMRIINEFLDKERFEVKDAKGSK